MSTETTSDKYHIKKFDNEGHNYSTWAVHCQTVLEDLNIWSIIDPELTLPVPTIPPSSSTSGKSPSAELSVTLASPGYGQGPLGPADIRSATRLPSQPLGPPGVPLMIWG